MSDPLLTVTFECAPGTATPELSMTCANAVLDMVNAVADDLVPGGMNVALKQFEWIDDGKDEIVVKVVTGE